MLRPDGDAMTIPTITEVLREVAARAQRGEHGLMTFPCHTAPDSTATDRSVEALAERALTLMGVEDFEVHYSGSELAVEL